MSASHRLAAPWRGWRGAYSRPWGGALALGAIAYVAALATLFLSGWGAPVERIVVSDLAFLPIGLTAAGLAWRASRHPALDSRTRRAWKLIAVSYLLYWLGDALWSYYEIGLGIEPFPSLADVAYVVRYPVLLAGLLSFPVAPRTLAERAKFWLDTGLVLLGSGTVTWYLVLHPTIHIGYQDSLAAALSLFYPVADLVLLLGVVAIVLRRPAQGSRQALAILALGLLVFVVADLAYCSAVLNESYQGGDWIDALWLVAGCLTLLSAHYQWRGATRAEAAPARGVLRPFSLLPYLVLGLVYSLVLVVAAEQLLQPLGGLLLGSVGLTGLVVLRQVAALQENARLLAENAARRSEERFRSLVQHSSDIITVHDADTTVRYVSPSAERVLGYRADELLGLQLTDLLHQQDVPRVLAFFAEAAGSTSATSPTAWRLRHRDGAWLHVEAIGTNLLHDPNVQGLVLNSRDVSERKVLEEQLAHQAFHDPLTNLANRALFRNRVQHALARADRRSLPLAVLMLDLDDFKTINDSLGHVAGDAVLVQVAERLQQTLRNEDTAARLGGDEFAILLEETDDVNGAAQVTERVLESLRLPIQVEATEVFAHASVGIALYVDGSTTADELLRNADVAMYMAKGRGKRRYEVFEPSMHAAVLERLELEAGLRRAVRRGELELHYQPIVDLNSGGIVGMEALVRWRHPQRGLIPPADFIPLAEETGLILPLGRWVLREACRQARTWQQSFSTQPPLVISVNLSARQLQDATLVDEVTRTLKDTGLTPASLTLEITESVLLQDTEAILDKLAALKQLGVQLAVDDFGTGYSSLGYLQRFPIDVLKIDKAFVDRSGRGESSSAVARAIVDLAGSLRLRTVAEGIEGAAQWETMRRLGCNEGQGFYFARPLTGEDVTALLGNVPSWTNVDPAEKQIA